MAEWWMQGGLWMWIVLLVALVALGGVGLAGVMAIVGRVMGGFWHNVSRVLAGLMVLGSLAPGLAGLFGLVDGRSRVAEALRNVDPTYRREIQERGNAEARVPLQFGVGTSVPLFGLAVVALLVTLPPTRRSDPG